MRESEGVRKDFGVFGFGAFGFVESLWKKKRVVLKMNILGFGR